MGMKTKPYSATCFIEKNQYYPGETMKFKVAIDNSLCHKSVEFLKVELDRLFVIKMQDTTIFTMTHKGKDRQEFCSREYKNPCGKE